METNMKYVATPKLGFGEAVKKVLGSMTDVKGRSRRSEYWWYMLATVIVNFVAQLLFGSMPVVSNLVAIVVSLSAVAVTVRRVQDTGHSAVWVYLEFVCSIVVSVYLMTSGFYEYANMVNPDIDAFLGIFKSPVFWLPTAVGTVTGIAVFIFALFDSDVCPNKYGESPKYVAEEA